MPAKNGNILTFFKPAQKDEAKASTSRLSDAQPSIIASKENVQNRPLPKHDNREPITFEPQPVSSQRIIRSSDDEDDNESDSEASLVDLTELLQSRNTSYRTPTRTTPERPSATRTKLSKTTQHASPLTFQPKPKYKFAIKALVSQSQKHEATEASAQRVKAIFDEPTNAQDAAQQDAKVALLGSVIADGDTGSVEKVLQAVERTEATTEEKEWYFFDPDGQTPNEDQALFPASIAVESWQKKLIDKNERYHSVRSGLVREMVAVQEELSEDLFSWILDAACMESTEELGKAYFAVLLAAPESIHKYLRPDTLKGIFNRLGAQSQATNLTARVETVNVCKNAYEKRDWSALKCTIEFLGDAAEFSTPATCSCAMSLLGRLCADSIVWHNIGLFSVVQNTMSQLCEAIESDDLWEISCRNMCKNIYIMVPQPSLCLQILRCIPDSTARLHELRRRLSLAVFCQDCGLTNKPAEHNFEFWRLLQELCSPRFVIKKETDYEQLAATMSLLDIAIDNGQAEDLDLSDPQVEKDFISDVDALAFQLKVLWTSINEVGALFISRIDAKEVMEGVRNRLIYTVRTRPKPKASIFDLSGKKREDKGVRKQSAFMEAHFTKPRITNGGSVEASAGETVK